MSAKTSSILKVFSVVCKRLQMCVFLPTFDTKAITEVFESVPQSRVLKIEVRLYGGVKLKALETPTL